MAYDRFASPPSKALGARQAVSNLQDANWRHGRNLSILDRNDICNGNRLTVNYGSRLADNIIQINMYIASFSCVFACFIDLQERMERDGTPAVGILRKPYSMFKGSTFPEPDICAEWCRKVWLCFIGPRCKCLKSTPHEKMCLTLRTCHNIVRLSWIFQLTSGSPEVSTYVEVLFFWFDNWDV